MDNKMKENGNLWIISAPSGAGKTSLIKNLLTKTSDIVVATSHTTRQPRTGEIDGESYYFVDIEKFEQIKNAGGFYESAQVFGNFYATSKMAVDEKLNAGKDVILEIDWQGARQIREITDALSIFILPPSLQELKKRLTERASDTNAVIANRMLQAQNEISHWQEYDYLVINDDFNVAVEQVHNIIKSARLRRQTQAKNHAELLQELLN